MMTAPIYYSLIPRRCVVMLIANNESAGGSLSQQMRRALLKMRSAKRGSADMMTSAMVLSAVARVDGR